MTRLIIDASLHEKLIKVTHPVELCDREGHVLGKYVPSTDSTLYPLEPQISKEELERRKQTKDRTFTTAEVLAHLEKL